jgi:hypothetical protein
MTSDDRPLISRLAMELAMAGLLLAIALFLLTGAMSHGVGWTRSGPEAGQVPLLVAVALALSSLAIAAEVLWKHRGAAQSFLRVGEGRRVASLFLPLLAFLATVYFLGLYVPTWIYIGAVMRWQGRYSSFLSLAVASGTIVAMVLIFELWFQIPLLKGPIEAMFGIS